MRQIIITIPDDCEVNFVKNDVNENTKYNRKPDVFDDVNDIYDSMGL